MKIAVISHPRSGSSKLIMILGRIFKVPNLGEILTVNFSREEKISSLKQLKTSDDYAVKFHLTHLNNVTDLIEWQKFDLIVSTSRTSLVDAFISTRIAAMRNQWTRYKSSSWNEGNHSFTINLIDIDQWINFNVTLRQAKLREITELSGKDIIDFTYEEICNDVKLDEKFCLLNLPKWDQVLDLDIIPTGINYKEKCLNYAEVEAKFKELGLA